MSKLSEQQEGGIIGNSSPAPKPTKGIILETTENVGGIMIPNSENLHTSAFSGRKPLAIDEVLGLFRDSDTEKNTDLQNPESLGTLQLLEALVEMDYADQEKLAELKTKLTKLGKLKLLTLYRAALSIGGKPEMTELIKTCYDSAEILI